MLSRNECANGSNTSRVCSHPHMRTRPAGCKASIQLSTECFFICHFDSPVAHTASLLPIRVLAHNCATRATNINRMECEREKNRLINSMAPVVGSCTPGFYCFSLFLIECWWMRECARKVCPCSLSYKITTNIASIKKFSLINFMFRCVLLCLLVFWLALGWLHHERSRWIGRMSTRESWLPSDPFFFC